MVTRSGRNGLPGVLLTREARWFFEGSLPSHVLSWFTSYADYDVERRIDRYDLTSARSGVGVKQKSTLSLDSKFRVLRYDDVRLADGVDGHVEDWLKISEPLAGAALSRLIDPIEVRKELFTRDFHLAGSDEAGCEAELSAIATGRVEAWSLCFETYGHPLNRDVALRSGITRLFEESPQPAELEFTPDGCRGYPEWIGSLALESA
jgi:hypothetical protein